MTGPPAERPAPNTVAAYGPRRRMTEAVSPYFSAPHKMSHWVKVLNGSDPQLHVRRGVAERWLNNERAEWVGCVNGVDQVRLLNPVKPPENHPYDQVPGKWDWRPNSSGERPIGGPGVPVWQARREQN